MNFAEIFREKKTTELIKLAKRLNEEKYALERELEHRQSRFTVSIFGSARVVPDDQLYRDVRDLAHKIGLLDINIVTGGGPGIMQAANEGAKLANPHRFNSFGVNIILPREQTVNRFVDRSDSHQLFSSRLDQFIRQSHMFIAASGGIGTVLELMYMWQLNQVGMLQTKKIIAYNYGGHWNGLIDWVKDKIVGQSFADIGDLDMIHPVDSIDELIEIVKEEQLAFKNSKPHLY